MTVHERTLTISDHRPQQITGRLPKLDSLEGGPWRVENPGEFQPGVYVMRFDDETQTVRIEPEEPT